MNMVDLYHKIYDGEIFKKSDCIWHENATLDFLRSQLINLGYGSISDSNKVWQRNNQVVVVCLVDDFTTCADPNRGFPPVPEMFDRGTVILSDTYVNCPTPYKVVKLPDSFFGIYNYTPQQQIWQPQQRFNFSINRLDSKRLSLFLELITRTTKPNTQIFDGPLEFDLDRDLVKFNCWSWMSTNDSDQAFTTNFANEFENIPSDLKTLYQPAYDFMCSKMPYCNHQYSLEQSQYHAWLNVVVETYSSNTTIALSEKMFRALVTPVPWIVYGGKYTVNWLRSMGFDVLDDVVNHRYDYLEENNSGLYGDKPVDFVQDGSATVEKIKQMDFESLSNRCQQAAEHNQRLLQKFAQQWPQDFAAWWPNAVQLIA